jgi:dual specificity protein kinase YAK1
LSILEAAKTIKESKLIHCDLKPENILLKTQGFGLKVIDLGSACFEGHTAFEYIQSRYYRSPEVIIGHPYDSAIDMWSIGCICVELFLGIPIFPGSSMFDQISKITALCGPVPQHMIFRLRQRNIFFIEDPVTGLYRLKTLAEYQAVRPFFTHNALKTGGVQIQP